MSWIEDVPNFERHYNEKGRDFLITYKRETITLAFEGAEAFKSEHPEIEARAVKDIDDNNFIKFVRGLGNLVFTALATISIVGVVVMYTSSSKRGGMLFLNGPEPHLSRVASKFDNIKEDEGSRLGEDGLQQR